MSQDQVYKQIIEVAHSSVEQIKDPELKKLAFEKILNHLLVQDKAGGKSKSAKSETEKKGQKSNSENTKIKKGPQFYVEELVEDGFFDAPKTIAEVQEALKNNGHHIAVTSLSGPLQKLTQTKILRRQKLKRDGSKQTFVYSNW